MRNRRGREILAVGVSTKYVCPYRLQQVVRSADRAFSLLPGGCRIGPRGVTGGTGSGWVRGLEGGGDEKENSKERQ